mmetsp:Transcript_2313/g.4681  ORF Transcript_2313/g.4681 Transcript_2313/m.4681 type:complete len:120 (-) Transcript_2313:668-1027(-)
MTIFTLEHDESKDWTPLRITIHDGIAENAFHRAKENISRNGSQPNTVLPLPSRSGREGTKMGEVDVEVGGILRMDGQETKLALNEGGRLVRFAASLYFGLGFSDSRPTSMLHVIHFLPK